MVTGLGSGILIFRNHSRDFIRLAAEAVHEMTQPPLRIRETIHQLYFVANESLPIILFCISAAAMVTILESSFHMKLVVQNDSMVPGFAAMLILRELGAVVTALLLTSRVGAGITAEVDTMKITEQIDALRMLGIRPVHYIVVPRLLASMAGTAIMTIVANCACLFVAYLVSEAYLGFTYGHFLIALVRFVHFSDLMTATIKGICFGIVIPLVSCHFGLRCETGAEGVGAATTQSVVVSSVLIIVLDFLLSFVFSFI